MLRGDEKMIDNLGEGLWVTILDKAVPLVWSGGEADEIAVARRISVR
ncbi:MAG: hypothetical protein M2R45_02059 [Verrucomicrobia subdivision 3 bacterium]|nr:hypothetical protein [Limisphaerales bacterium]MCS1414878.1 hypothetical protein [Limisphaerales bacterium]